MRQDLDERVGLPVPDLFTNEAGQMEKKRELMGGEKEGMDGWMCGFYYFFFSGVREFYLFSLCVCSSLLECGCCCYC